MDSAKSSAFEVASSPGPTQISGKGPVSLPNFLVCAESAYYATHPNNHIYVIDLVRLSRGKNSKECDIIDDGML